MSAIPGSNGSRFPDVHSVAQYLNTFGVMIAERIKSQFQPLFDPAAEALSPEILAVNETIKKNAGYSLYDAQLAVCEALAMDSAPSGTAVGMGKDLQFRFRPPQTCRKLS